MVYSDKIPRNKIPWYPTIDYDKCAGCQECYNFCRNNVYQWDDENNHPNVSNPYNCVVGCSACANLCPNEAIHFPTKEELAEVMKKLKEEANQGK